MKLVPTAGNVIVRRDEAEERTPGGLVLPDTAKDKPSRGKIIAVGKGPRLESGAYGPVELVEGCTAVFSAYRGTEIKVEGEEFVILGMTDIIAVISN